MLTDRQRARCREIAAALDRHDQRPWLKAEPSLSVAEKGAIWDMRAHVIAAGGRAVKAGEVSRQSDAKPPRPRIEASLDLDYWADTDDPPSDDPDDELDLKTKVCDNCRGSGVASDGTRCARCNGSGRVDRDDVDDGDDDDDDREKETDE